MALAVADTATGPAAVAVVCDGVSSSARPDEAALAAASAAAQVLVAAARSAGDLEAASTRAVAAAVTAVAGLTRPGGTGQQGDAPAATFVSAVVDQTAATVCWLGDSRAYWLQDGSGSRRLTTDDSVVQELAAAGLVSDADAPDAPGAHVVTAWIGADLHDTAPHLLRFEPPGPGVLLLCSDGLWNYQPEAAKLAELTAPGTLPEAGLLAAAAGLVRFAIDSGGMDNVTVVLIPFPLAQFPPAPH